MKKWNKTAIFAALAVLVCASAQALTPEEMLFTALKDEDIKTLQVALEQGANPNTELHGKPILMYVCEKDWYEGVKILLENGAHIEIKDKADGKTALMYAVKSGNTMIIRKLIEEGANINAKDFEGKTALMYAIEHKHDRDVDFLLRQGANCLATDNYGNNVAMYAVRHRNITLLRELVRNPRINWNKTNNEGISPFAFACINGDLDMIKQILQYTPIKISASRIDGQPILIWLIAHKKSRITIEYIMKFCTLEEIRSMIDYEGHDVKYWAEKQGYERVLAMLDEIEEKDSR